jgi:hypothetical protein
MYWKAALGITLAAMLLPWCALAAQPGQLVTATAVKLQLTGGYVGAETLSQLEQAINDTVHAALIDQLGGDLDYIVRHQRGVVKTLGEVIAPVLSKRGFSLEELAIDPGVTTSVSVQLHLAQDLAENFTVQFHLLGSTPVIDEVVGADQDAVASALFSTIARTPFGDTRWFTGLVTDTVEQALARLSGYGDFEHLVLVEPGATTKVSVTFTPRQDAPALADYSLSLASLTLLTATLTPVRDRVAHNIQSLLGAPLSFITPRLSEIERAMYQDLVNCSPLSDLRADACLTLKLSGCKMQADLCVDSQRYLTRIGAKLDLWEHGDQRDYLGRVSARIGFMPQEDWAVYGDVNYYPSAGEAYPMLGVGRLWKPQSFLGAGYDFKAEAMRLQAQHAFSPLVYISADIITGHKYDGLSEIALHYRIRDFYELQLISNLDGEVYAAAAANF